MTKSIHIPPRIIVTEQEIDLTHFTPAERKFVVEVFHDTIFHYERFGKARAVFGIAGPSGAGKSVLAVLLREIALTQELPFRIETISIDAFHFPNEYLATEDRDGKNLKEVKGRYDTYDTQLLSSELARFLEGDVVRFPLYSRRVHDPIPGVLPITEERVLLIVEGLWLLYDHSGWELVRDEIDYTYFLDDELERLKKHTVLRHVRGGRTEKDAEHFYDKSDLENYKLVEKTKKSADQFISWPNETEENHTPD